MSNTEFNNRMFKPGQRISHSVDGFGGEVLSVNKDRTGARVRWDDGRMETVELSGLPGSQHIGAKAVRSTDGVEGTVTRFDESKGALVVAWADGTEQFVAVEAMDQAWAAPPVPRSVTTPSLQQQAADSYTGLCALRGGLDPRAPDFSKRVAEVLKYGLNAGAPAGGGNGAGRSKAPANVQTGSKRGAFQSAVNAEIERLLGEKSAPSKKGGVKIAVAHHHSRFGEGSNS